MSARVEHGDSRVVIAAMADASVDAVVTDPPYALVSIGKRFGAPGAAPAKSNGATGVYARAASGFMGQRWDTGSTAFDPAFWVDVLRVLKPGGHVLAFGGTRTYHRLACAIEDAGFEIRDMVSWLYGAGFPKSHDVSKGLDKSRAGLRFDAIRAYLRERITSSGLTQKVIKGHLGYPMDSGVVSHWVASSQPHVPGWRDWQVLKGLLSMDDRFDGLICTVEREKIGDKRSGIADGNGPRHTLGGARSVVVGVTAPATDAARQWDGWGTALKPACEPIVLARKPLIGTVAANVLAHGTGALNINGCRITIGQRPNGDATWVDEPSLCDSCAALAERGARHSTPEIKDTTATKAAAPTASGRGLNIRAATGKMDIGCSVGTMADDTAINSSIGEYGSAPMGQSQSVTKSTITMRTEATTASKICASCGNPITSSCTSGSISRSPKTSPPDENSNSDVAPAGRWPANLCHDGSDEVLAGFPDTRPGFWSGETPSMRGQHRPVKAARLGIDSGSAARFFYCAKAGADDRVDSRHPTIKPVALMRWLVRLICPPGGTVLDPFAGSGTTGVAAMREGCNAILIERETAYVADIRRRIAMLSGGGTPLLGNHMETP